MADAIGGYGQRAGTRITDHPDGVLPPESKDMLLRFARTGYECGGVAMAGFQEYLFIGLEHGDKRLYARVEPPDVLAMLRALLSFYEGK